MVKGLGGIIKTGALIGAGYFALKLFLPATEVKRSIPPFDMSLYIPVGPYATEEEREDAAAAAGGYWTGPWITFPQ